MLHSRIVRGAVVIAFALVFAVAAFLGAGVIIEARNRDALDEISETALRYAELAVVSARNLLDDVAREGPIECGNAALQRVRLRVYEHSVIKDIRVLSHDGAVRCSAYSETLEFDRDWPSIETILSLGRGDVRLFRVEQFTSDALGVFKDVDAGKALAAIVAIDPLQLDVLPSALRAGGQVALELTNGETVAASAPSAPAGAVTVGRTSTTYPLRIAISLDRAALRAWNAAAPLPLLAASGTLGAFFGLLIARRVNRPLDPAQALDAAIRAHAFRPYYQPIFAFSDPRHNQCGDRRIVGCEVLMRWVLADGRVLPPSAFIPLAESTGRIDAMTWQVFAAALGELRAVAAADPAFKISVNIVPRHFLSPGFRTELGRVVEEASVPPGQVVLELTERDELGDLDRAKAVIRALREDGFRLAMDDVGVGHSGLSHIQSLRPDTLKIDKFFVDALGSDMTANVVVDMLVRLARELGACVVAEGIETEIQLAALAACGVQQGQGYLVSPPVPLPAFLTLIERQSGDRRAAA